MWKDTEVISSFGLLGIKLVRAHVHIRPPVRILGNVSKRDSMAVHKGSLSTFKVIEKFKKILEIIQSTLTDHNELKSGIDNRNKCEQVTCM